MDRRGFLSGAAATAGVAITPAIGGGDATGWLGQVDRSHPPAEAWTLVRECMHRLRNSDPRARGVYCISDCGCPSDLVCLERLWWPCEHPDRRVDCHVRSAGWSTLSRGSFRELERGWCARCAVVLTAAGYPPPPPGFQRRGT